jgi:CDGSH-type Zn-finger protein
MEREVTIVAYKDGPYVVRGPVQLCSDADGAIETERRPIALCRCGHSNSRPFCDGTHKLIGFRAASGDAGRKE